ncbi:MAG TPA: sodium:calcium antiporter [Blastocatellia bacterium]|nr:sodium:calcium antiporter [Blastocatellia bacterium]
MQIWLQFGVCTAVILAAGTQLSKYGDVIAEKTGLSRTWVGVALMASVTSLPELITGLSSVTIYDLPNLAAGDVIGSCMFNILIIALLDHRINAAPLSSQAHQGQVLSAAFGILMLGIIGVCLAAGDKIPALGWIGLYSPLFILLYLAAMRLVYLHERKQISSFIEERAEKARYQSISKARAYTLYTLSAAIVVAAATYLPRIGDQLAEQTGLGRTFVGSILIAMTTSLPEVVVSFAALRIGAVDLAVGNLFGSNLFNIGILALDDILYTKGPILSLVSNTHLITAIAAMTTTAIAVIGLTYRAGKKIFVFGLDSIGIITVYAVTIWLLYSMR